MKQFILAIICLTGIFASAQSPKWFVSFSTGYPIGGPSASIRHQLVKQGFDHRSETSFFGWSTTTHYPRVDKKPFILLRGGFRIRERKSLYFIAGRTSGGTVAGFRNTGYADLWIIAGSIGPRPEVDYSVYQLTAGYQYASAKSRAKLGLGPTLFLFTHSVNDGDTRTALLPGASFTGRFPLGKEKRLFGVDLLVETSLAPPARIRSEPKLDPTGFKPGKANMINANIGLCFSFRN